MEAKIFDGVENWCNTVLICTSQEERRSLLKIFDDSKPQLQRPKIFIFNEELAEKEYCDAVVVVCSNEKLMSDCLNGAFLLLKPNGKLSLYTKDIAETVIKNEMLFAGFIDFKNVGFLNDETHLYCSEKPNFSVGHTVLLRSPKSSKAWNLEDDALIDEDALLEDDDLKKPTKDLKLAECASAAEYRKKRRPCKNCTCGLAEELEQEKAAVRDGAIKSNCGNCALGDAFRCSNCPYLGMPPFKTDETGRVQLSNVSDV